MSGLTGDQLKYGIIKGNDNPGVPMLIDASQQFRAKGGRFVSAASGYMVVSVTGSAIVTGFCDCEEFLSSSTQGADVRSVVTDGAIIVRLPVAGGTFSQANVGLAYDLIQATIGGVTLVQGVDLTATTRKLVIVVGGDLVNNTWVDVMMNPSKRAA